MTCSIWDRRFTVYTPWSFRNPFFSVDIRTCKSSRTFWNLPGSSAPKPEHFQRCYLGTFLRAPTNRPFASYLEAFWSYTATPPMLDLHRSPKHQRLRGGNFCRWHRCVFIIFIFASITHLGQQVSWQQGLLATLRTSEMRSTKYSKACSLFTFPISMQVCWTEECKFRHHHRPHKHQQTSQTTPPKLGLSQEGGQIATEGWTAGWGCRHPQSSTLTQRLVTPCVKEKGNICLVKDGGEVKVEWRKLCGLVENSHAVFPSQKPFLPLTTHFALFPHTRTAQQRSKIKQNKDCIGLLPKETHVYPLQGRVGPRKKNIQWIRVHQGAASLSPLPARRSMS